MSVEIVPLTEELIISYYECQLPTLRGIAVLKDGEPVGIAGLLRSSTYGQVLFSDLDPEFRRRYPIQIVKMMQRLMKLADEKNWTVWADADMNETDAAERFLEHYGFEKAGAFYRRAAQ